MVKGRSVLRLNQNKQLEVIYENNSPKHEKDTQDKFLTVISLATELGFSISLPIAGGAFLGQVLDKKLNLAPKMTLSLIFLGLFIGLVNIHKIIKEYSRK